MLIYIEVGVGAKCFFFLMAINTFYSENILLHLFSVQFFFANLDVQYDFCKQEVISDIRTLQGNLKQDGAENRSVFCVISSLFGAKRGHP